MKIDHLNCGTMSPVGTPGMVCHVLMLTTDRGITLVDTGFGVRDVEDPAGRIGPLRGIIRPEFSYAETALAQVQARGHDRRDVTDIVATHLDSDHAGGLADFPHARLHVSEQELRSANGLGGMSAKVRYRPWRGESAPADIEAYSRFPDSWFGFAATPLSGFGDDAMYVALPGHTDGHMGLAVREGGGWLLHCGDAFYHRNVLTGARVPALLAAGQRASAQRPGLGRRTRQQLSDLHAAEGSIRFVCAHDAQQLAECVSGTHR